MEKGKENREIKKRCREGHLAPADFFFFPKLKSPLKGRRFQAVEEIEENSIRDFRAIPQNKFRNWKNIGSGYQEWRGVMERHTFD